MRDGTIVALETDQEPDRLDLREAIGAAAAEQEKLDVGLQQAFESAAAVRIFLAIPRTKLGRANVQDEPSDSDARYTRTMIAVQDENRSGHEQEIQFRRLNARFLLSTQDCSGYELLPIAQVKRASDAARGRKSIPSISRPSSPSTPGPGWDATSCARSTISSGRKSTS